MCVDAPAHTAIPSRRVNSMTDAGSNRPGIHTVGVPLAIAVTAVPNRPDTWKSGNTASRDGGMLGAGRPNASNPRAPINALSMTNAMTFALVSTAAFGRPVVPLVNRMIASSSSSWPP
jgi:hypothetical protein